MLLILLIFYAGKLQAFPSPFSPPRKLLRGPCLRYHLFAKTKAAFLEHIFTVADMMEMGAEEKVSFFKTRKQIYKLRN